MFFLCATKLTRESTLVYYHLPIELTRLVSSACQLCWYIVAYLEIRSLLVLLCLDGTKPRSVGSCIAIFGFLLYQMKYNSCLSMLSLPDYNSIIKYRFCFSHWIWFRYVPGGWFVIFRIFKSILFFVNWILLYFFHFL